MKSSPRCVRAIRQGSPGRRATRGENRAQRFARRKGVLVHPGWRGQAVFSSLLGTSVDSGHPACCQGGRGMLGAMRCAAGGCGISTAWRVRLSLCDGGALQVDFKAVPVSDFPPFLSSLAGLRFTKSKVGSFAWTAPCPRRRCPAPLAQTRPCAVPAAAQQLILHVGEVPPSSRLATSSASMTPASQSLRAHTRMQIDGTSPVTVEALGNSCSIQPDPTWTSATPGGRVFLSRVVALQSAQLDEVTLGCALPACLSKAVRAPVVCSHTCVALWDACRSSSRGPRCRCGGSFAWTIWCMDNRDRRTVRVRVA